MDPMDRDSIKNFQAFPGIYKHTFQHTHLGNHLAFPSKRKPWDPAVLKMLDYSSSVIFGDQMHGTPYNVLNIHVLGIYIVAF